MTRAPVEALSAEDARILGLERHNIRGHTCKIVVLDGRVAAEQVRARVLRGLDQAPQLRRKLATAPHGGGARPGWVEESHFDVARHVQPMPDEGPIPATELDGVVGRLMAEPLRRDRPLWQMDVVDVGPAATAIVWRIHHCLADGIASVRMADAVLFDNERVDEAQPDLAAATSMPGRMLSLGTAVERHEPPGPAVVRTAGERELSDGIHPSHQRTRILAVLRRELRGGGSASPLAHHVGPRREVAFATAPLARLKDVAHRAGDGVTLNDLILTVVGGALSAWMSSLDSPATGLRAKVPVSLHDHDPAPGATANHDSFMFVDLDVNEADPLRRLLTISRQTRERKRSHDAEALDTLFRDLGRVSRWSQDLAIRWSMSPHVFAVNVSNVPGPPGPLSVAGAPVTAVHTLAEVAERHALRVAVISAAGTLSFGLCADPEAVAGVDLLAQGIEDEIDAVTAADDRRGGKGG